MRFSAGSNSGGISLRKIFERLSRHLHARLNGVDVDVQIRACRDSKDDKFLELAISGLATHVVTGDSDLLALNPFRGIQIISPQAFLEL